MEALDIEEICRRARALRLSTKALAALAGLNPGTVYDAVERRCRPSERTRRKMTEALVAEERAELKRLAALHGQIDL